MATKQTRLTPFGRKVRKRLIDKNMTQVELAALLGCNKQYIHKILVGERSGKKYIEAISRMTFRNSTNRDRSSVMRLEPWKRNLPSVKMRMKPLLKSRRYSQNYCQKKRRVFPSVSCL